MSSSRHGSRSLPVKDIIGADREKFGPVDREAYRHAVHRDGVDQHRLGKIILAGFEHMEGAEVHYPIGARRFDVSREVCVLRTSNAARRGASIAKPRASASGRKDEPACP